jgi:hypothetical protein
VRRLEGVALSAGLREELGVLLEDLEVLLFFFWWGVRCGIDGWVRKKHGLTMSVTGSPTRRRGGLFTAWVAGAAHREYPAGAAVGWAWK